MKAVVWRGRQKIAVEDVPPPQLQEPTDAIIRVTSTGICGSDLHLYGPLWPVMKSGDIIGHEAMGIVETVGSGVGSIRPGDRVVIPFNISCGSCPACLRDLYSQCEKTRPRTFSSKLSTLGRGKGASIYGYTHMYGAVPGGQAQYLRVPQAHFGPIKVPEHGPDERYVLLSDVLPTAWQAVAHAEVQPGCSVAVFGLGPIGQMAARIALNQGASKVIGIDLVPERLELARKWGAQTVDVTTTPKAHRMILEMTDGEGADSVIEAVGMEANGSTIDRALATVKIQFDRLSALKTALRSVRRGGVLSVVGVYAGLYPMFPLGDLFDLGVTVRLGQANVHRWSDQILDLLSRDEDTLGVEQLITHRLPIDLAPQAYEWFREKRQGCIKAVLDPWAESDAAHESASVV